MTGHYTLLQKKRMEDLVTRMQERSSATGGVVEFKEKQA